MRYKNGRELVSLFNGVRQIHEFHSIKVFSRTQIVDSGTEEDTYALGHRAEGPKHNR